MLLLSLIYAQSQCLHTDTEVGRETETNSRPHGASKGKLLWNVVCLRNTSHLDLSWAPSQKRIPVLMELLFLKLLWNAVCLKIHLR